MLSVIVPELVDGEAGTAGRHPEDLGPEHIETGLRDVAVLVDAERPVIVIHRDDEIGNWDRSGRSGTRGGFLRIVVAMT